MTLSERLRLLLSAAGLVSLLLPQTGLAQAPALDPGRANTSRAELDTALQAYTSTAASTAYSKEMRAQAEQEADLIRLRLDEGDFQTGDQIALVVEGEAALTDTFAVQSGPSLTLPQIGTIPLRGVLRSELEDHLRQQLRQYIREPVVHARASIRMLVTGGVGQGGYLVFPTNSLLTDALMRAGGPAPNARLERLRIERNKEVIWEGEPLQQAIIEGRTLDQMSLRAGDHIIVPTQSPAGGFTRYLAPLSLVITTITALSQIL